MKKLTEKDILRLIEQDSWMMEVIRAASSLDLPDSWIGAGFVRSKVWDHLHGYRTRTPIPDIDVIYLDKEGLDSDEKKFEEKLKSLIPDLNWEVTNQARMHIFHNDLPYESSEEALSKWVETATCVGVRLFEDRLLLAAPRGIDDLVSLILRPTPEFLNSSAFEERIKDKEWLEKWPRLKVAK